LAGRRVRAIGAAKKPLRKIKAAGLCGNARQWLRAVGMRRRGPSADGPDFVLLGERAAMSFEDPKFQQHPVISDWRSSTVLHFQRMWHSIFLFSDLRGTSFSFMLIPEILPLGSIEAIRPVFMIVMGVSLMLLVWRFSKGVPGWSGRLMLAGALLLGFGYSVILPLNETGKIQSVAAARHFQGDVATALAWQLVRASSMNIGWLALGLGLALHARSFAPARRPAAARISPAPHSRSHESVA